MAAVGDFHRSIIWPAARHEATGPNRRLREREHCRSAHAQCGGVVEAVALVFGVALSLGVGEFGIGRQRMCCEP